MKFEIVENTEKIFGYNYEILLKTLKSSDIVDEPEEMLNGIIKNLEVIQKKPSVVLYRIIYAKSEQDINKENIGNSFVQSPKDFHEQMLDYLYNNAIEKNPNLTEDDYFVVKVETPSTNVDYKETLITNCEHPYEQEITIQNPQQVKILEITK